MYQDTSSVTDSQGAKRHYHHLQLLQVFGRTLHPARADQSGKTLRPLPEVNPCPHRK